MPTSISLKIVGITGTLKKDYADARFIYDAAKKAAKT